MSKKNTVRRKMSMRDYVTFMNFIENGEREIDLSEYEPAALDKAEIRVMYLTPEQKSELPSFITDYTRGVSVKQLLNGLPKISSLVMPTISQQVAPEVREKNQPDMILPGDEEAAKKAAVFANLPHWIKDPAAKIAPDNIDAAEVVRIMEKGEQTVEEMQAKFVELGTHTNSNPDWLLAAHPNEFEEELEDRYTYCVCFLEVMEVAAKKYALYVQIMTEEPPSAEENFERYFNYILSNAGEATHENLIKYIYDSDAATSISGNKIVFDNDDEKTLEYDNAEDMEKDFLYAVHSKRADREAQVDIFGKKISALKIAQKLYKKYPQGIPNKVKFYHSRKEAFEDGALEL